MGEQNHGEYVELAKSNVTRMRNKRGQFIVGHKENLGNTWGFKKGHIPWSKGAVGLLVGYWKGKTRSEEVKRKISQTNKLRGIKPINPRKGPLTLEHKQLLRKPRGDSAWNWKGGITPLIMKVRNCFEYKEWRKKVFERDNWTCRLCNTRGGSLEADHYPKMFKTIFHECSPKNLKEALAYSEFWNTDNGRTLCKGCHRKAKPKKVKCYE